MVFDVQLPRRPCSQCQLAVVVDQRCVEYSITRAMNDSELKKLSETNRMLLLTMAALQIPGIWFLAERYTLANTGSNDTEAIDQANRLLDALVVLEFGLRLATAVVFVRWMVVLYRNAVQWAPERIRHSELWVTISFFIPIAQLFIPFQIMMDLWRASSLPGRQLPPTLVIRWWTLWIGASFLNYGAFLILSTGDPTPATQADGALFMLGARLTLIPCALIAIKLVRTLTLLQRLRTEVEL